MFEIDFEDIRVGDVVRGESTPHWAEEFEVVGKDTDIGVAVFDALDREFREGDYQTWYLMYRKATGLPTVITAVSPGNLPSATLIRGSHHWAGVYESGNTVLIDVEEATDRVLLWNKVSNG